MNTFDGKVAAETFQPERVCDLSDVGTWDSSVGLKSHFVESPEGRPLNADVSDRSCNSSQMQI